jgi:hypothetical protein
MKQGKGDKKYLINLRARGRYWKEGNGNQTMASVNTGHLKKKKVNC